MTKITKLMVGLLIAILCVTLVATLYLTFSGNILAAADDTVTGEVDTIHSWTHSGDTPGDAIALDENGGEIGVDSSEESPVSYYLSDNVTLQNNITVTGYVEICLNGFTLNGTGEGSVITVSDGSTLTLYDCNENASIGVITCDAQEDAVGVYVEEGGTFTMMGGKITDNDVGVHLNGTFNISGIVDISGNSASNVYIVSGKLINVTGELGKDEVKSTIGITLASSDGNGVFANVSENVSEDVAEYFTSDVEGKCIGLHDDKLVLATHVIKLIGTEAGHYQGCANCGAIEGDVTPHDWNPIEYVPDSDGIHHYQQCDICGYKKIREHVITNVTRRDGSGHTGNCDICGAESVKMPHKWEIEIIEPTETETGKIIRTCRVCDQSISETIPATGSDEPVNPADYQNIVFFWLVVILAIILLVDVIVLIVQLVKLSNKHAYEMDEAEKRGNK